MTTDYENIPVFQANSSLDTPESVIGKATIVIDEKNGRSTITIEGGEKITNFFRMGVPRSLGLNATLVNVDTDLAVAYHEELGRKKSLWENRTER